MVENSIIHKLIDIGLSEYEARAYMSLLAKNPATAYELAKASFIPTSKIYEVLSRLVEKGIISMLGNDGKKRYVPMEPDEFIEGYRSRVEATLRGLKEEISSTVNYSDVSYIWNIRDYQYLMDKAKRMIHNAKKNILLSTWKNEMANLEDSLRKALKKGTKIAVIHFGKTDTEVGQIYQHPIEDTIYSERGGRGFDIVVDSREVLIGTILKNSKVEGAWSMNRGFVTMAEDYIKHDIYIMKIVKRFDKTLKTKFGNGYVKLRDIFTDEEGT